jgi:radical SAM superfamily enzyme YgiQ (UPF0313 family)
LAGLTPAEIDVRLIDENVESIDLAAPADFVAISCMTASAPRAYEVADAFRERGIPVVMGGIHPSVMPDEAGKHADAVAIGEAEPIWATIVHDLAADRLRARYQAEDWADLTGMPLPRRDLLRTERYLSTNIVQTARGCPYGCSFCSVTPVFGTKYRFRPIPEVIEEIRTLKGRWIGFVDDNIVGHPRRAKELFEALIPLRVKWIGQADLSLAGDAEMLALAKRSGCQTVFMGLESLSIENLQAAGKVPNLRCDMGEAVDRIQEAGIEIVGSFVLGLDGDDVGVFQKTAEFAEKHHLMAAQFAALTPLPGTATREQLLQEGRIFDSDWAHYTMRSVVFEPKRMTPVQLAQGLIDVRMRFFSIQSILKRCVDRRGRIMRRIVVNLGYRGIVHGKAVSKITGLLWRRSKAEAHTVAGVGRKAPASSTP